MLMKNDDAGRITLGNDVLKRLIVYELGLLVPRLHVNGLE